MIAFIKTASARSLTQAEELSLDLVDSGALPFNRFSSLSDLRSQRTIKICLDTRASIIKTLADMLTEVKARIDSLNKKIKNHEPFTEEEEFLHRTEAFYIQAQTIQETINRANGTSSNPLLGLYSGKVSWNADDPVVYLFLDNIDDYAQTLGTDSASIIAFVYVHEMMHAYFDSVNNQGFPPKEPLEEAFAEYGMLYYLSTLPAQSASYIFQKAVENVKEKQDKGPHEYGFGFELFTRGRIAASLATLIERYALISNWIDPLQCHEYYDYTFHVKNLDISNSTAYHQNAQRCYDDVIAILNYPWAQPTISVTRSAGAAVQQTGGGSQASQPTPVYNPIYHGKPDPDYKGYKISIFARDTSRKKLTVKNPIIEDNDLDNFVYRMLNMSIMDVHKHVRIIHHDTEDCLVLVYDTPVDHFEIPLASESIRVKAPERWFPKPLRLYARDYYIPKGWVEKLDPKKINPFTCTMSWALGILNEMFMDRYGYSGNVYGHHMTITGRFMLPHNQATIDSDPSWAPILFYVIKEEMLGTSRYILMGDDSYWNLEEDQNWFHDFLRHPIDPSKAIAGVVPESDKSLVLSAGEYVLREIKGVFEREEHPEKLLKVSLGEVPLLERRDGILPEHQGDYFFDEKDILTFDEVDYSARNIEDNYELLEIIARIIDGFDGYFNRYEYLENEL